MVNLFVVLGSLIVFRSTDAELPQPNLQVVRVVIFAVTGLTDLTVFDADAGADAATGEIPQEVDPAYKISVTVDLTVDILGLDWQAIAKLELVRLHLSHLTSCAFEAPQAHR